MRQTSGYIWFVRFLCVFLLVLAFLFARQVQKEEKETQLAVLATESRTISVSADAFVWQREQAKKLQKLADKFIAATDVDGALLPVDGNVFQAMFITDTDGLIVEAQPKDYFSGAQGFLKPAKGQLAGSFTIFLPEPFSAPALALPLVKEGRSFILYAVIRSESLALFSPESDKTLLTIVDNNENIVFSTDKYLTQGENRLKLTDGQYTALGGGFFKKEHERPSVAFRANTRGFFGWAVFCEQPVDEWAYGYIPMYISLLLSFLCGILSLYLAKSTAADKEVDGEEAENRAKLLKTRLQNVLRQDRGES